MSPSGFGEPSGAQNLWSPGFVVVRLCMRINSVDTGPTSLTPERPRANERGSRPQEWPSARQGRCGSARATRRSPRRRGRWPRPSLSTGSTTARRRRQEAWGQPLCADGRTPCRARRSLSFRAHEGYTNTPAGTEEPQPPNRARGPSEAGSIQAPPAAKGTLRHLSDSEPRRIGSSGLPSHAELPSRTSLRTV